ALVAGCQRGGAHPGGADMSAGGGDGAAGCDGLRCYQDHDCIGGARTTITGTAYAPSGRLPLYDAVVYVPDGTPDPVATGAGCGRCTGVVSGDPLVTTQTRSDGSFTLVDVPAEVGFPLVVQVGKWRRQVMVPPVPACVKTALTDPELTRLGRGQAE